MLSCRSRSRHRARGGRLTDRQIGSEGAQAVCSAAPTTRSWASEFLPKLAAVMLGLDIAEPPAPAC
jgi:hypothetical protein